jgi:hypothetical protein
MSIKLLITDFTLLDKSNLGMCQTKADKKFLQMIAGI